MSYEVKRGFSKRRNCYMYGIYKDGELYENTLLYGRKNAQLIVGLLTLMDEYIIDHENGTFQIMQILRMDKEREKNGKVEYRV